MHITVTTPGTPLWLTIVTLAISVSAVIISLWQATLNHLERRLNRPSVSMECGFVGKYHTGAGEYDKAIMIAVNNGGREATTISHILVQAITIVLPGEKQLLYGRALPYRLESHSDVLWAVRAELIEEGPVSVSLYCGHSKPLCQQYLLNRPNISTYEWIRTPEHPSSGKIQATPK
jgi:hypothetical protein